MVGCAPGAIPPISARPRSVRRSQPTFAMRTHLYEVWLSSGRGIHVGPKFKLLQDAIRYVETHAAEASHAVRAPDGSWKLIERRHV